jgi:DNA-binding HxlR family transcriptional regulator
MQSILLVDCKRVLWQAGIMPVFQRNRAARKAGRPRRSPCPVACLLDIVGDRWSLLIVRDLILGQTRFRDFAASSEGIPTNILSDRLERLLSHRIIEQIPARDGTKRLAYRLTEKGEALRPVLKAMRDWGLTWEKSTRAFKGLRPAGK